MTEPSPFDQSLTAIPAVGPRAEFGHAIRAALAPYHARYRRRAMTLFVSDVAVFLLLDSAAIVIDNVPVRVICALAAGFQILRLASIAHDAAHHNYTGNPTADRWIARAAFLPALQPLGTWEIAHNVIHHAWTSIRGKDYVWIPKTKPEFDRLPAWRRSLERIYRSVWGHGLYYLVELWCLGVLLPAFRWTEIRRRSHRMDIALVGAFALVWASLSAAAGWKLGRGPISSVLFAVLLPFLVWCEAFGLTLYLQHTNPRARFFRDRSEAEFYSQQIAGTVHIEFPRWIEWLFHGIFEHTAHHLDTTIPFYGLHDAQRKLNGVLAGTNVTCRWSWHAFLQCCRVCKLYDYERHCWLSFSGDDTGGNWESSHKPTSSETHERTE